MAADRRRIAAAGLVVATLLAGCVSTPTGPVTGTRRGPSAAGEEGSAAPSAGPGRADRAGGGAGGGRGGYYLDDGPGDAADLGALAQLPDPVPLAEPLHPRANQPYRVMGNDYRPMVQRTSFRQRGVASWYGRKFHGQPTSIGERYDMYRMTAAHPTLPIPSFARVTNVENGRTVVVRVNDRGPFLHGRAIDLSYLAAYKLGYVEQGSAEVEVELLDPSRPVAPPPAGPPTAAAAAESPPAASATVAPLAPVAPAEAVASVAPVAPPPRLEAAAIQLATPVATQTPIPSGTHPAEAVEPLPMRRASSPPGGAAVPESSAPSPATASNGHYLQLGAFSARANAEAASIQLRRQLDWLPVPIDIHSHGSLFRVQAGPFAERDDALRAGSQVRSRTGLRPMLLTGQPN